MKVDGTIVHFESKDIYLLVCCYQSEVSKYVFSNSKKSSWIQAKMHLGLPAHDASPEKVASAFFFVFVFGTLLSTVYSNY